MNPIVVPMNVTASSQEVPMKSVGSLENLSLSVGAEIGYKGEKGDTGVGIASCVLNPDYTLTITLTDGTSYTTESIRGAQGEKGADGAAGKDGRDGIDGVDGKDGKDGINGKDGADGKDGAKGDKGDPGDDYVLTSEDKADIADLVREQITIPTKTSDLTNDSGFITGMEILSYGHSTWADFLEAYTAQKVVYCRASSGSNPGSGSQTRLAFMAYVNNASASSITEVEFQYYRSVSSHSATQQGDQVYIYKLNKSSGWSVTVREAMSKIAVGTGLKMTYSNGTITISLDS